MQEHRQMLSDSVTRLFAAHANAAVAAESSGWQTALWGEIEALGIPSLLVAAEHEGFGGTWEDAYFVLHACGLHQVPLPVAESMLAARLASTAGLKLAPGPMSVSVQASGELESAPAAWKFTGKALGTPWGRNVTTVITVIQHSGVPHVLALDPRTAKVREAHNLAQEPRDDLSFTNAPVLAAPSTDILATQMFEHLALARTAQIAGALESALHRSISYAMQRKQFGRAISQFQAVQQQLAVFGSEAAAVACAARAAARAASHASQTSHGDARWQIGAAKLRANQAIGVATAVAHEVHAAIGFTREYALRLATQRLWSWRTELGNDRFWSERLAASVLQRGADQFWSDLVARDDEVGMAV